MIDLPFVSSQLIPSCRIACAVELGDLDVEQDLTRARGRRPG